MPREMVSIRVTKGAAKEALGIGDRLAKRCEKALDKAAEKIAKRAALYAKTDFKHAEYAGPQRHIDAIHVNAEKDDRGWRVTAEGFAVEFIEYGTGVEGNGTYEGKVPASYRYDARQSNVAHNIVRAKDHWVFEMEDADFGKYVEPLERRELEVTPGRLSPAETNLIRQRANEGKPVLWKKTGKYYRAWELAELLKKDRTKKTRSKDVEVDENYGFTGGNKANNCMYYAYKDARENTKSILREEFKKQK